MMRAGIDCSESSVEGKTSEVTDYYINQCCLAMEHLSRR